MATTTDYSREEIVRRAQDIYERDIRPMVEPAHNGEMLVLNVATGEYVMDADDILAAKRAKERFEAAPLFTLRVGHKGAYRLGGGRAASKP
jgi:hypothetical protein